MFRNLVLGQRVYDNVQEFSSGRESLRVERNAVTRIARINTKPEGEKERDFGLLRMASVGFGWVRI